MQQKTITNKQRLLQGGKVMFVLLWAITTIVTCSEIFTSGDSFHKAVAGIALLFSGAAIVSTVKRIWDNE